jgi:hypothetical protein
MLRCPHCHRLIDSNRTNAQNSALWLFFTQLATTLNDMGLEPRKVLKPEYNLRWTRTMIHDDLWIPFQKKLFKSDSTTLLKKIEQIDLIHKTIMRELGEKFGVEYIPFPNNPEREKAILK